jgi:uncharacterized membrane protein YhaH (DUF805 family)
MSTAFMIRSTIVLVWVIVALAGLGVARFFDLLVNGWPALATLVGILIGGKTFERVKELTAGRGGGA